MFALPTRQRNWSDVVPTQLGHIYAFPAQQGLRVWVKSYGWCQGSGWVGSGRVRVSMK